MNPLVSAIYCGCCTTHIFKILFTFKKNSHLSHIFRQPFLEDGYSSILTKKCVMTYEGSNWNSSFALGLSVKHGFYFARTHSFSIEQQKSHEQHVVKFRPDGLSLYKGGPLPPPVVETCVQHAQVQSSRSCSVVARSIRTKEEERR